eukprot:1336883-Pyramimonas_sp.AAC.1
MDGDAIEFFADSAATNPDIVEKASSDFKAFLSGVGSSGTLSDDSPPRVADLQDQFEASRGQQFLEVSGFRSDFDLEVSDARWRLHQ